jgi:hypothetical protein
MVAGVLLLAVAGGAAAESARPTLPGNLPAPARARLGVVTDQATLATRVDGAPFTARRELFEFLLDHPELATHVTRQLRFARYRIWQTPEGLAIDDGWGTTGTFEVVHAGPGMRVMAARGVYHQRVLPDIHGQAVVMIDYGGTPATDGRSRIQAAVSGWVKLDSALLAWAARLATAVAQAKADKEGRRLVRVFAKTTRAVEDNPAQIYEALRRRPDVPQRDLEEFRRLLNLPAAVSGPSHPAASLR